MSSEFVGGQKYAPKSSIFGLNTGLSVLKVLHLYPEKWLVSAVFWKGLVYALSELKDCGYLFLTGIR